MDPTDPSDVERPPGKLRTWWHPLLVGLLATRLKDSCEVQGEVNVGRMPLRLDILLIRRLSVEIPESAKRELHAICERLNAFTLIEFKSPVDSLARGDWNKLLACAHLYIAQSDNGIPATELTLIVLAPRLTKPFHDELRQTGVGIVEEEPGIHRIDGAAFRAFVVETDRVAGAEEPVLTVVSHEFIEHHRQFLETLGTRHPEIVYYVYQQVEAFRNLLPLFEGEHMTEQMTRTLKDFQEYVLKSLSPQERLRGLSIEEVLKNYSREDILRTLGIESPSKSRKPANETPNQE